MSLVDVVGRLAVVFLALVDHCHARGFHGIPGRYCSVRSPTCCESRDDECTAPILGNHLCYCDMFCDRGPHGGNDCCPDFEATCRGSRHDYQADLNGHECISDGVRYRDGDSIEQNCRSCACVSGLWKCDESTCLIQEDLLEKVQNGRFSWSARNYSFFWGRSLDEGVKYRLGTLFPEQSVQNMNEIVMKPRELPAHFDARDKWPGFIHDVRDQGDCGSSWAVSTTTISSDRLAIITDGRINVTVSPQQLLSCNQHRQRGCEGGYLDRAWWYIRKLGVVDENCYPYESGRTREPGDCRIPKQSYRPVARRKLDVRPPAEDFDPNAHFPWRHRKLKSGNGLTCPSNPSFDSSAYKMTPPYRVSSKEEDIMAEIITNGPVQATFLVHEDFFMYSGGVYRHTDLAAEKGDGFTGQGYHSVRVLGWGVDHSTGREIPYWLAANSWGRQWGEDGLFRIVRGENHCEFESFIIGAWGKGAKLRRRFKMRKMRRRFRKM